MNLFYPESMRFSFLPIIVLLISLSLLSAQIILHTETYENGNIKSISYHQKVGNAIKKIKHEEFFDNGNKYISGSFKNGEKSGVWIEWNEKGERVSKGNYKNGKRDGFWEGWHSNGTIQGEVTWLNGKENGLWVLWYENGKKMREVHWQNGKRNGKCLEWYENGIKKLEGYWIHGFKDGKWEYWYDSGKILKEEIHENGKMKIEKWY